MMCDVFTQEAWTCLKAQFVCGRHALDTDMAGTWLLLCLQGVGRIFFFFLNLFLAWLRHGHKTATSKLKNKNKGNSAASASDCTSGS